MAAAAMMAIKSQNGPDGPEIPGLKIFGGNAAGCDAGAASQQSQSHNAMRMLQSHDMPVPEPTQGQMEKAPGVDGDARGLSNLEEGPTPASWGTAAGNGKKATVDGMVSSVLGQINAGAAASRIANMGAGMVPKKKITAPNKGTAAKKITAPKGAQCHPFDFKTDSGI